jgi:hypothetical protein
MVVSVDRYSAHVAPRSASSGSGIPVLRSARPDCFTEGGSFYDDWTSVLLADLAGYESRGQLPAADRDLVVGQYRANLARRRRARRPKS